MIQHEFDRAGELSHGRPFGHFLEGDGLMIFVDAQTEFGFQGVAVLVMGGIGGGGDGKEFIG